MSETLIAAAASALLLVVVALGVNSVRTDLKQRQVAQLLKTLDEALAAYHQATGFWPPGPAGRPLNAGRRETGAGDSAGQAEADTGNVLTALLAAPACRTILQRIPAMLWTHDSGRPWANDRPVPLIQDAWGRPLRCLTAASNAAVDWQAVAANGGKPIFVSAGVDGLFGTPDSTADADNLRSDELLR